MDTETGRARDLSSLWVLASSAALFSQTVKERYLELLPNRVITDAIGASETGTGGLSTVTKGQMHPGGPTVKISSTTTVLDEEGNPVQPGSGVRGLIAKSGHIPVGYFKDEKKTAETFKTFNGVRYAIPGDWATVEADGTVTMLGRGSVSINTGGEKVFPEEVESVLKGHPAVFDAVVVGVPDEKWGQHVGAVIAVREGVELTFEDLDTHARKEIAGYKVPRSIWIVDSVKRNPAGKADYRWAKEVSETEKVDLVNSKHVNTGA
ncbi:long-chain-fatty-acid--CoA ligase FadD [Mycobacteroides abscessus subsp. massiliense]|nr:long-chain-fatty-acid--CoA ligase FadD [Mycobacteroides abscessus subsp. massiliense]